MGPNPRQDALTRPQKTQVYKSKISEDQKIKSEIFLKGSNSSQTSNPCPNEGGMYVFLSV